MSTLGDRGPPGSAARKYVGFEALTAVTDDQNVLLRIAVNSTGVH
jgi:hypothetical protein